MEAYGLAKATFEQYGHAVDRRYTPELVEKVHNLIANATAQGKVTALETIKETLLSVNLAWYNHCKPSRAGVSPKNRSALGIVGNDAQWLGDRILDIGWSDKKTEDSSALQMPPAPLDKQIREFNKSLSQLSDGLVPDLQDIDVITVGGGHTTTFLHQVVKGVKAVVKSLSDTGEVGGNLSYEQLTCNRPSFKTACDEGLRFWIAHWQAAYIWPQLADFLQDALNIIAKLSVSEIEVALKLQQMAEAAAKAGVADLDWAGFEHAVSKSNPTCKGWIKSLSEFVRRHAGGLEGAMLKELAGFAKSMQDTGPKRLLGSEYINAINALNFGKGVYFPYIVNSAIELQLVGPKVVDDFCKFVHPSNLKHLTNGKNRSDVQRSEELMREARTLVRGLNVPKEHVVKHLGRLDVRLCAKILKLGKSFEGVDRTIADIAAQFVKDVSSVSGQPVTWALSAGAQSAQATAPAAPQVHLDSPEELSDLVRQAKKNGFTNGAFLIQKGSEHKIYQLDDYLGQTVKLSLQEDGYSVDTLEIHVSDALKHWAIHKGSVTRLLPGWTPENLCDPLSNTSFKCAIAKSKCIVAVSEIFKRYHMESLDHIELLVSPNAVKATSELAIGELVLAPCSSRFETTKLATSWYIGKFDLDSSGSFTKLFMQKMFTEPLKDGRPTTSPWVVPFFHVLDAKDGPWNMEVRHVDCDGVKVLVLTNSKKLVPGTVLKFNTAQRENFESSRSKLSNDSAPRAKRQR